MSSYSGNINRGVRLTNFFVNNPATIAASGTIVSKAEYGV